MEQGRRVSVRLERIEALQRGEAPNRELLAELRGLLEDGEAWLGAVAEERVARSRVRAGCREQDEDAKEVTAGGQTRTLI
jgi:hypothetical protein